MMSFQLRQYKNAPSFLHIPLFLILNLSLIWLTSVKRSEGTHMNGLYPPTFFVLYRDMIFKCSSNSSLFSLNIHETNQTTAS